MRQGSVRTLAAVASVAMLTAGLALWHSLAAVAPKQTLDQPFLPQLAGQLDAVAEIKITTTSGTVIVKRAGGENNTVVENNTGVWVLPDKDDYPAAPGRAEALLQRLAAVKLMEAKTADPARYTTLGLAIPDNPTAKKSPAREIELLDAARKSLAAVVIGDIALSLGRNGGGVYVRRLDDPQMPQAFLAEGIIDVPATAADWLPPALFELNDPQVIAAALVTEKSAPLFSIERSPGRKDLRLASPALATKAKADQALLLPFIATAAQLGFDDVRRAPASQKPFRVVEFVRAEGGTYTLKLFSSGKADTIKGIWVEAAEAGMAEAGSFNQVHSGYQYHLPDYRAGVLTRTAEDFLQKAVKAP